MSFLEGLRLKAGLELGNPSERRPENRGLQKKRCCVHLG
jgi:hypothetical protein